MNERLLTGNVFFLENHKPEPKNSSWQLGWGGRYLGAGRPSLNEEKLPVLTAQLDRIPRWPESTEIVVIRITTSIIPEF